MDILLCDFKAFVVDQCSHEINHLKATGSLEEKNHAAQRERFLDQWKRQSTPWGQGEPYRALIMAVVYGPRDDPKFAPSQPGALTTGEFAEKIVECMDPPANLKSSPLWVKNGAFKELAPIVWDVASVQVGLDGKDLRLLMHRVVSGALMARQVCRLPWLTVSPQGAIGRHIGLANWITIERSEKSDRREHRLETPAMRQERRAAELAAEAEDQDRTAAWLTFSGKLSDQRRYIQRTVSPDDLDFKSVITSTQDAAMKTYLTDIAAEFSLEKPSHRLGLRVASLVSRLLPLVNLKPADGAQRGDSVDRAIQNGMVWCQSTRKDSNKGLNSRDQWGSTFMLAWLFYQSTPPTHQILQTSAYSAFLKKLGTMILIRRRTLTDIDLGAKMINGRLFIRLQLAHGGATRILEKGGAFGREWTCVGSNVVNQLIEFVDRNLEAGNVEAVVSFFLGADGLRALQEGGGL